MLGISDDLRTPHTPLIQVAVIQINDDDTQSGEGQKSMSATWAAISQRTITSPSVASTPSVTSSSNGTSNQMPTFVDGGQVSTKPPSKPIRPIVFEPVKRPDKATLEAMGSGTMWGYITPNATTTTRQDEQVINVVTAPEGDVPADKKKKRPAAAPLLTTNNKSCAKAAASKKAKPVAEVQDENLTLQQTAPTSKATVSKPPEVDVQAVMRAKAQQALVQSIERKAWDQRFTKAEVDIYADELVLKAQPPHPITGTDEDKGR